MVGILPLLTLIVLLAVAAAVAIFIIIRPRSGGRSAPTSVASGRPTGMTERPAPRSLAPGVADKAAAQALARASAPAPAAALSPAPAMQKPLQAVAPPAQPEPLQPTEVQPVPAAPMAFAAPQASPPPALEAVPQAVVSPAPAATIPEEPPVAIPEAPVAAAPSLGVIATEYASFYGANVQAPETMSAVVAPDGSSVVLSNGAEAPIAGGTIANSYTMRVSDEFEKAVSGKRVRVTVKARASYAPLAGFAVAYSTNEVGNSGWRKFDAGAETAEFVFEYDVNDMVNGQGDFVGIAPSPSGPGVEVSMFKVEAIERT